MSLIINFLFVLYLLKNGRNNSNNGNRNKKYNMGLYSCIKRITNTMHAAVIHKCVKKEKKIQIIVSDL